MVNKLAISTDTDLYDPGLKKSVKAGLLLKLAAFGGVQILRIVTFSLDRLLSIHWQCFA